MVAVVSPQTLYSYKHIIIIEIFRREFDLEPNNQNIQKKEIIKINFDRHEYSCGGGESSDSISIQTYHNRDMKSQVTVYDGSW